MPSTILSEAKAISAHFTYSDQNKIVFGFMLALRDARGATGRDPSSGSILYPNKTGCWLGAIGYCTLLDQIGSCFKDKKKSIIQGNTISKALGYFTRLSQSEIDVIYALRNAFAHDFSLSNINNVRPHLTHRFKVTRGSSHPLITLPFTPWDGDYLNYTAQNETVVNLERFGNLVESVYLTLINLHKNRDLEIVLPGGSDELIRRYMIGL